MTGKKRALGSDFAKADAHVITPEEYDEIPEWTDEDFARATPMIGDRVVSEEEFRAAVRKILRPRPKPTPHKTMWVRKQRKQRKATRLPKQTKRA